MVADTSSIGVFIGGYVSTGALEVNGSLTAKAGQPMKNGGR